MIPALLRVWLNVSEILTSLMLVYVAQLALDWLVRGPWKDPGGHNLPVSVNFDPEATLPILFDGGSLHLGVLVCADRRRRSRRSSSPKLCSAIRCGLSVRRPRRRASPASTIARSRSPPSPFQARSPGLPALSKSPGRIGQLLPSISPGYGFSAIIVAFLGRLSPVGIFIAGLVLALTFVGGEDAQIAMHLPGDLTLAFQGVLLICVLAADVLARYRLRFTLGSQVVSFDPQQIQDILMIIVAAATPLLLAAIGEVVAERAGVLNLGLEGMMIVGASTGFAFAYMTDSTIVGVVAGILRAAC